jgi:hypothetical protein
MSAHGFKKNCNDYMIKVHKIISCPLLSTAHWIPLSSVEFNSGTQFGSSVNARQENLDYRFSRREVAVARTHPPPERLNINNVTVRVRVPAVLDLRAGEWGLGCE